MTDWFEPRKIAAGLIVTALVGILGIQYVRALAPSAHEDRMSPCRALKPTQFNPRLGSFPSHSIDFAATDAAGQKVSLSQHRGRVVFLNFWQTDCPPCVEEMPSMERLAAHYGKDGLSVLALASERSFEPIRKFWSDRPTTMSVLLDPPDGDENVGRISLGYGTLKWPESYLIDKRGVVRYYYINSRDWSSQRAKQCIQALLDE